MNFAIRHRPTSEPNRSRVAGARVGVMGLFFSMGVLLSTFLSRLPTIRDELGVHKGTLSTLLIFGAAGALVALLLTGWAVARFGTRAVLLWTTFSYTAAYVGVGLASHLGLPWMFAACQFFVSFSFAFTNVSMNAEAAAVERFDGRKIMSQFHAGFSVGMAVGLAVGWVFSHAGIEPAIHLGSVAVVLALGRFALIPMAAIDGRPVESPAGASLGGPFATARAEYRETRVLMLGAIIFAASMTEGSAAQWIAISGVDDFGQRESTGDAMYWLFVVAMVTVRSLGARVLGGLGRVKTLRLSATSAIAGLLIFAFTPTTALLPVALILWGVGAALGVPIGFSAAADEPKRAAARVAAVSSFATVAGLVVPPIIGHLAEAVTTRHALLVVIVGSLTSFALAPAVRRDGRPLDRIRRLLSFRRSTAETAVAVASTDTGTTTGA